MLNACFHNEEYAGIWICWYNSGIMLVWINELSANPVDLFSGVSVDCKLGWMETSL